MSSFMKEKALPNAIKELEDITSFARANGGEEYSEANLPRLMSWDTSFWSERLKETKAINSSLSCLSNVIEALQGDAAHVPFRDSKLTHLLKDSLVGDSKTLAIVCCNPLTEHFSESIGTLKFGAKCGRVELKAQSTFSA